MKRNENDRKLEFLKELEELSNKYKISIEAVGGLIVEDDVKNNKYWYECDYTSGDLIYKKNPEELITFDKNNEKSKRFQEFGEELSKISEKYNIGINSVGGVNILKENENVLIKYDLDYTSGDVKNEIVNIDKELKEVKNDLKDELENKKEIEREFRNKEEKRKLNRKLMDDVRNLDAVEKELDNNTMTTYLTAGLNLVIPALKDFYKIIELEFRYYEDMKLLEEKLENEKIMEKMYKMKNDEKFLKEVVQNVLKDDFNFNEGKMIEKVEKYLKGDFQPENENEKELVKFLSADKKLANEFVEVQKFNNSIKNVFNGVNKNLEELETKIDIQLKNSKNLVSKVDDITDKKELKEEKKEEKENRKENRKENIQKMRMRR